MATIQNRQQKVRRDGFYMAGGESRVIGIRSAFSSGPGAAIQFGPFISQRLILLRLQFYMNFKVVSPANYSMSFRIYYGTGTPATFADIERWTRLDKIYLSSGLTNWTIRSQDYHLDIPMGVVIEGVSWRFGVYIGNAVNNILDTLTLFEIREF